MKDEDLIWKLKDKKAILKTRVFTVNEKTCISPEGNEGIYIVNDAPEWAIVIPELEDSFLMVKQWRHGEDGLSIEFPGGVIDKGENPEEGIRRELLEETGTIAKELIHLGSLNPNPALFSNHVHIYCARNLEFTNTQNLDEDEFLNCIKIPKAEVFKKMGSKEYPHALMASALSLYFQKFYFNN